ncbi:MAG: hypothetical protein COA83_09140 [Methylophaga sp.]|nr:MAG: hypothetical protein COA83_09140 [Methylophaga sp.]
MKNIFSMFVALGLSALIGGCTDNNNDVSMVTLNDTFGCDEPVLIDSEDNQPAPGFLIYIDKSVKTSVVEEAFSEKYEQMTIFSSFPRSNSFYANIDDEALKQMQCEENVIAITTM